MPNTEVAELPKIKVALVGGGNCASAFIQGLQYYGKAAKTDYTGLRNPQIASLLPQDIQVVAAFDVDERKVGKDLAETIFAMPNNAPKIATVPSTGIMVHKGPLMDGVGAYTKNMVQVSKAPDANVANVLRETGAEIVINLLPSGAAEASAWYAEQALKAGCAFVNATPNFIASDSGWAERFTEAS